LVLVVPPLLGFFLGQPPGERLASLVPAIAVFVAILVWMASAPPGTLPRRALVATVLLTLLAVVVVLVDPASHWLLLFFYASAAAGLVGSVGRASVAVIAVSVVATAAGWSVLSDPTNRIERPLETALVGFASLAVARLLVVYRQLAVARAEIARLAAADERLRIARDLHDLLGQGLSVIALKAQLAARLLPADPARAAIEVADIEGVSRRALDDVRAAVSGYRRLRSDGELIGAQAALEAAGVATDIDHQAGSLPDDVDEAFAWSLREGVTNVIRHAGATKVVIRTRRDDGMAVLEVIDDGRQPMSGARPRGSVGAGTGTGLAGLAERVGIVGGHVEAAPLPQSGFRLAVTIPLEVGGP
ncbi:MAG: two-component system, NarL family, sensor histidine kinase DesK, partial [Acidimicrobiaceae bacterium]